MRTTRTRPRTRTLARRVAVVAASATAALVLAACGGDGADGHTAGGHGSASSSASSPTSAGAHNAQDVSFAQGMIPHHRQALEMAGLAADQASSAEVKDLAARVEKAQDPEIETMTGWLKAWGEDVPSGAEMPGMDHSGGAGMPGMMGGKDMAELEKASGTAFDTLFLTMMVEHHEGAVEMATAEKKKGAYGPATAMADDIVTAQTAEIAEMKKLLGTS
ncbi:DUF305 domain-containing protein [Streptomyces sp. NBC_00481]|uniref:DUF305 domain-containing protein n=1 Tax=unclassified Streptomyces TaxID=2593676 RepID=UPI002DD9C94E|nr:MULTISPECIES: DUF305 domain-containing protein [unclassified Streptomyces]WRY98809.1 DUF305 domain-containing protein [Streptomyces sp. NBC_00481]